MQDVTNALQVDNKKLTIGLFPDQFQEGIELQPGEKKTHDFYISFNDNKETLAYFETPPEVTLDPAWIEKSRVFPNFDRKSTRLNSSHVALPRMPSFA